MRSLRNIVSALVAGISLITLPALSAAAQTPGTDSNAAAPFGPPVDDQHVWIHAVLDQFEGRIGGGAKTLKWDGEVWGGTDTHRVWLKSEGVVNGDGQVEDGQQELFYSRPISTYFDVQVGARYDLDSRPGRAWAAFGIEGLAPMFFHVSATAYVSDKGNYAAKLRGSYDLLLTQRLILQPEIEMNVYGKDDPGRRIGSGLSDIDTGLRLRYEITRKFAPYIGVTYESKFGKTGRFAEADGESADNVRFTVGIRMWL